MKLIAIAEFPYGGKTLKRGDTFDSASDEDARILKGVGKAKDAPAAEQPSMETRAMKSEDLLNTPRPGRRYNRRDMRAKG